MATQKSLLLLVTCSLLLVDIAEGERGEERVGETRKVDPRESTGKNDDDCDCQHPPGRACLFNGVTPASRRHHTPITRGPHPSLSLEGGEGVNASHHGRGRKKKKKLAVVSLI